VISFSRINKQYGRQILFVDASFQLNPGEKVGLVGPNGSGKTTLFRLIVGEEVPDDGEVSVPRRLTIGYFRQDVEEMSGRSVLDEAIAGSGRLGLLHHELGDLQNAMIDPERAGAIDAILSRFGEVQEEYDHLGGYALESRTREILHGLGFDDERIDGDVGALSGGWKMRVGMARVLLGEPDVLLMDEPTNHLDIESIIWLETFLKSRSGALLMTSHDREFMNRVVTRIAEIDGGEITAYSGNYDFYERERALREANREAAYARQQAMLAKEQRFIERFAAHAAKAAQVQSRVKALEKIEKIELPKKRHVVKFDAREPPRSGDQVATLEGVTKRYGRRVVHDHLNLTIRRGERWAVMGKNGAGKSTLLKMIAGVLPPDGGVITLGASLKMGYFAQQALDLLDPDLTIEEQLRKDFPHESIGVLRSLAGAFEFSGDDVDKKIRALSGGEKTRLVMARMLLDPPNFLVLDEPTNHLDLWARDSLERSLAEFDGTVLLVSHDRYFLNRVVDHLLVVEPNRFRIIAGNYDAYLHLVARGLAAGEAKVGEPTGAKPTRDSDPSLANDEADGKRARRKRRFPYRKVPELEREILDQETRLEELNQSLSDPQTHRDGDRVRQVKSDIAAVQESLRSLYEHWEEAVEMN
jgi:ATPase subunit of ABC transporter with duplicated ATPase domains